MSDKDKKGFNWDGKSRVVTALYRKNFNKIFGERKEKDEEENTREHASHSSQQETRDE